MESRKIIACDDIMALLFAFGLLENILSCLSIARRSTRLTALYTYLIIPKRANSANAIAPEISA